MKIKPIETKYKGYRFRSRLEARWAVFFDTLKYDWEYEPEGFDLGGLYYLPDFKVFDTWYEVKAKGKLTVEDAEKIVRFVKAGNDIIYLDGTPDIGNYIRISYDGSLHTMEKSLEGMTYREIADFLNARSDPKTRDGDILWWKNGCPYVYAGFTYYDNEGMYMDFLVDAVKKARSARFEHGENPGRYDNEFKGGSILETLKRAKEGGSLQ